MFSNLCYNITRFKRGFTSTLHVPDTGGLSGYVKKKLLRII